MKDIAQICVKDVCPYLFTYGWWGELHEGICRKKVGGMHKGRTKMTMGFGYEEGRVRGRVILDLGWDGGDVLDLMRRKMGCRNLMSR